MHDNQKILLRAAKRIWSHLHGLKAASISVELPDGDWTQCQSLTRQVELCTSRNWHDAAAVLKDRLERALERCSDRLQEICRQVSGSSRLLPPQTTREIFDDLVALSDEFEGGAIDGSTQTLSVTTEPIVLEEFDLGPSRSGCAGTGSVSDVPTKSSRAKPTPRGNRARPHTHTSEENSSAKATDESQSIEPSEQDACWTSSSS